MVQVTLIDGTLVPSDSERWRVECLRRHQQCQELLAIKGRAARAEYIDGVGQVEGAEAASRLKGRFLVVWRAANAEQESQSKDAG